MSKGCGGGGTHGVVREAHDIPRFAMDLVDVISRGGASDGAKLKEEVDAIGGFPWSDVEEQTPLSYSALLLHLRELSLPWNRC